MTFAFLLTSHWHDEQHLVFWWKTEQGVVRQQVEQQAICFIQQQHQAQAERSIKLLRWPIEIKPVALKHFNGQPVSACYLPNSYRYRWQQFLAEQNIPTYEVDIRPTDRYLMERFVYGQAQLVGEFSAGLESFVSANYQSFQGNIKPIKNIQWQPTLRALSLDIETSFARLNQPDHLYSVSLYADDYELVLMIGETENTHYIEYYPDESSLLLALLEKLNTYDPDVIMGWNIVQFDFQFLIKKFQQHGLEFNLGRDGSALTHRYDNRYPEILYVTVAGRVILDGIGLLRNAAYSFESFSLNNVAEHFLGEQKLLTGDDRSSDIDYLFKHDKPALAAYNLKDSELVWRIFEVAHLLEFAIERSSLTGLLMDRIGGSVAAFENQYLPLLHRAGYIAPNEDEGFHTDSPGGYVLDSKPGLFKHVLVFDFKSLYPSIIRSFNIDPMGMVEGLQAQDTEPELVIPGFLGAHFHRHKHILPNIIAKLGEQREQAKKVGNKALNNAIKIIMASCYGVLGAADSRFSDSRLTASITMRGQQIIQQSANWINQQGDEVIYGDTDSLFVWLDQELEDEQVDVIGANIAKGLSQHWQRVLLQEFQTESCLELEYEVHYRQFFMPYIRGSEVGSKKRYAGLVYEHGQPKVIYKGLESVRSDWTALARAFQQELYQRVFLQKPYKEWLYGEVQALLLGEKDQDLIYRKRLGQPLADYMKNVPPHAQAARKLERWLKAQGQVPRFTYNGGRIEYVVTLNGPEPLWPDGSANSPLDYQHYLEKQLQPIAEAIFHFTGDDFAHIAGIQLSLF